MVPPGYARREAWSLATTPRRWASGCAIPASRSPRSTAGTGITARTHRCHQVSPWHIAYTDDTVEEQASTVMAERIAAASDSVGGDTAGLTDVAELPGADWLPTASPTEGGV